MTARGLRAITNFAMPCSPVRFVLPDGSELMAASYSVDHPRETDPKTLLPKLAGTPTLTIVLLPLAGRADS